MKKKILQDITANMLQLIIVQSCGLVVFYLLSTRLSKNEFGEINWALAVLLTAFGILAFGIDQIAIRRIASGIDPARLLSTYINHVLIAGFFFYGMLWVSSVIFSSFSDHYHVLLLLGFGKLMIFFSTPFKQIAIGLEKFRSLLLMAVISNFLRALVLIVLGVLQQLNIHVIVIVFVVTDLSELLVCVFIMQKNLKVSWQLKWNRSEYKNLVTEAFPQFGVAIFTSALSRLDWILLGILSSNVILAEYSFAYKVFEMATLPMLVIAPVLIPRFTRLFRPEAGNLPETKIADLFVFLRLEIIIASLSALLLNILWVPVIDWLTNNKYGAVNQTTMLLLSTTMPFLYFNNFLWTVNFAKGQLKMILYIFAISFIFNLVADIVLIPLFGAKGAALAYLAAIMAQSVLYLKKTKLTGVKEISYQLLFCPLVAVLSYLLITSIIDIWWISLIVAPVFFFVLLCLVKQIRYADWHTFKRIIHL
ncbi:MAG: oligosaccharide flippase family protein [Ferruginibacter sp.]